MTSVSHVTAMYATKRRRRNSKKTVYMKDSHTKSNPSKRHRERLNQELDSLASLLPFEQSVRSKLDKLSILRLSVSYLCTKSYFQVVLPSSRYLAPNRQHQQQHQHYPNQRNLEPQPPAPSSLEPQLPYPEELRVEGDLIVQALNGFLLILTCDGEVFYTSQTVETYLGFHQSDICHQSVYELVHSEDREELMQQLKWNSMIHQMGSSSALTNPNSTGNPLQDKADLQVSGANPNESLGQQRTNNKSAAQMSLQEILASADHLHLLERNFTVRFRCLLDNTSGFLRLDIRGRIKVLHGQKNQYNLSNSAQNLHGGQANQKSNKLNDGSHHNREPILAFFGICIPFGPPSLLEMPSKDSVFKSKHRLDLSLISMDARGKQLLGLQDLTLNLLDQKAPSSSTGVSSPISSTSSPQAKVNGITSSNCSLDKSQCLGSPGGVNSNPNNTTATVKLESGNAKTNVQPSNAVKQKLNLSAYDLVHHDDLSYMASAHQELLKTGASGLIAYRMICLPEGKHQWLQTSAKLYYKNSKPDFILCTHRPLMEEEGRDLLGKRTMDFKVTYLDVGLNTINDKLMSCDKYSSLQDLAYNSSSSTSANAIVGASGSPSDRFINSSPSYSNDSSRSSASCSPESSNEVDARSAAKTPKGRPRNSIRTYTENQYNSCEPNFNDTLRQNSYSSNGYQSNQYKQPNGGTFHDMDAGQEVAGNRKVSQSACGTKKKNAKSNIRQSSQGNKNRDYSSEMDFSSKLLSGKRATKSSTDGQLNVNSMHPSQQVIGTAIENSHQLQLYGHYTASHGVPTHMHLQQSESDGYNSSAIQAAAAYAAGVQHQVAAVAYGGSHAAAASHSSHHGHYTPLYSSSIVSPSQVPYGQHQSQTIHSQHSGQSLHQLDSSSSGNNTNGYHQQQAHQQGSGQHRAHYSSAYGSSYSQSAAAAAAASSFLPTTEHLLQHYTQSAARNVAALAAWPSSDYCNSPNGANNSHPATQGAYAAAAAAAAALAARGSIGTSSPLSDDRQDKSFGQRDTSGQYQQQAMEGTNLQSTANKLSSQRVCYSNQQSLKVQHGPASLNSDGFAHRSPLSSGDSSNGSGCITGASNAAPSHPLSSSELQQSGQAGAYYSGDRSQVNGQQQTSSTSPYAYNQQSAYALQHYTSGAGMQYGQHQLQSQQNHHYHQTSIGTIQQVNSSSANAGHLYNSPSASAYFHPTNELSSAEASNNNLDRSTSAAIATAKLYGSNGVSTVEDHFQLDGGSRHIGYTNGSEYYGSNSSQGNVSDSWISSPIYTSLRSVSRECKQKTAEESDEVLEDTKESRDQNARLAKKWISLDGQIDDEKEPNQRKGDFESSKVGNSLDTSQDDNEQTDNEDVDTLNDMRDPLARLISSTIGDIMLDIEPKNLFKA